MRKISLLCLVILLAASCAQVLTPDGGAKDLAPPVVVDYSPDSAQTNFTGNKIVLRFNEFVQLKDLNNQLIISPPLNQEPDVVIRKRDIVITLKDTLLPNTTYTISFGNAIRDITEGNILDNFRYVFSTGPVIDSLKISGKVLNAANLNPEKGIFVMLYAATGDSVPLKQRPYYFTKTKEDGTFQMTNLKAGKYKLFALDDKNANYLFDNSEERIAFPDELIDLSQNTEGISLKIFKEVPTKQIRIKAQQSAKGKFFLSYALPLKDPQVTFRPALPAAMEMHKELSVTGDTLDFWFSSVPVDSIQFIIYDAATQLRDSVTLMIDKSAGKNKGGRGGDQQAKELMLNANAVSGKKFDLGKNLVIVSNNPLKSFTPKDFILMKGKDTLKTDLTLSENKRLLTFNYTFLEDSSYSLFVKPGAITDWFAQKNDTIKVNFKIQESRHYGTLNVKLSSLPAGNYALQLTNDKNMVLRELKISDNPAVKFDLLPPGNYRLKVIADQNKNGKWDTGNYLQHRQPENIIYYDQGLKMRSGWDMDIEWIFK